MASDSEVIAENDGDFMHMPIKDREGRNVPLGSLPAAVRARIEAGRVRRRTPQGQAEEDATRAPFADRPSLEELVRRGEIEPGMLGAARAQAGAARLVAGLKRERERLGLTLHDVAERSGGIDPATLSRLENARNLNPTVETLGRYAAALGLTLEFRIVEPADCPV